MAQPQKGLGRGLEALLGGYQGKDPVQPDSQVPLTAIRPNPEQPRRVFSESALADLAASIREQGILQPVVVRPIVGGGAARYEIIAGERRWRAAQLAGLTEIPVLVREVSDEQSLALALIENLQREDLNPMEQAAGLQLLQTRFGMSQDDLAKKVGMSRPAVANSLRLLQLPETMRSDLASGALTAGHARALLAISDAGLRSDLWQRIVGSGLSVREAEDAAAWVKTHGSLPDMGAAAPAAAKTSPRRAAKSSVDKALRGYEDALTRRTGLLVKTSGSSDHGKIVFQFSSRRELASLLATFGLEAAADEGSGV